MKKLLLILLLISSVQADTYSINPRLDSLRANLLGMLNSTTSGNVTTSKANFIINMSIGKVCDEFPAIEKVDTIAVTRAQAGYSLNNDFLRVKSIFQIDQYNDDGTQEIWLPVNYVPYDSLPFVFDTKKKNAGKLKTDTTLTAYTWDDLLYFHPKNYKPIDDPDSFVVFYYARDRMLTADTDSTRIAPEYMEELLFYMMSWVRILQEDYDASNLLLNRYNESATSPKPREVDLKR